MEKNTISAQPLYGKKLGSGLVFGKFMPFHEGHRYLLNFAQRSVHKLTILVCSLKDEPIPGEIRFQWIKESFPEANVIHHYQEIPQDPSEDPNFWQIWDESIRRHCPGEEFDCLFGSEDYGWKMAERMGIRYIPVNRVRNLVPISGTEMRENPMEHWEYLPAVVRPYFLKKVCVVGPESSGKSTFVKDLAKHYNTVYAEEYGHNFVEEYLRNGARQPGQVLLEDFPDIARGQLASEDSLAQRANRVMFCDTDLITTQYWANFYTGSCPEWIAREADKRTYDLYLLLDTDVPFVQDGQRVMDDIEARRAHHKWWEMELIRRGRPFVKISGNWQQRFATAQQAVDSLLAKKPL